MAKRATDTKPFRPLQAGLLQDVLGSGASSADTSEVAEHQGTRPEPASSPAGRARVPARPQQQSQPVERQRAEQEPEADALPALDPRKKLSREKRYLLTQDEEDRIEQLARSVARAVGTPVKLSHLVRVALTTMLRIEVELQNEARSSKGRIQRPANGDMPGLLRFEQELGRLFDSALRKSSPSG